MRLNILNHWIKKSQEINCQWLNIIQKKKNCLIHSFQEKKVGNHVPKVMMVHILKSKCHFRNSWWRLHAVKLLFKGVISQLQQQFHARGPLPNTFIKLCCPTDHFSSSYGDKSWGCGYRNLQMLLSALIKLEYYKGAVTKGVVLYKHY